MPSSQHEITLEKLTYGGEAMGRLSDGRAVFVPFGLPGETVRIQLTQEKQNFARGEILEIIKPSPDRIEAKCKHAFSPRLLGRVPDRVEGSGVRSVCGGCHYQNLPYEKQLTAKADILRDQLQRIGKIENPIVQPTVASPEQWNYRNHVQFHLTDDGKVGFINARGNTTLPIEECHLPEPAIDSFRNDLQFESRMNLERVSLRSGADDDLMLILESETEETPELEIEADISIVHIYEDHPVVIAGSNSLTIQVLGKDFHVSAPSFFQVNTKMAEKMVQHLQTQLPITNQPITNQPITNQPITLLDLYCGVGLFSKFFADKYAKVIGIESAPSSCEDFAINLDEFDNVELYEGAAEEILPALAPQLTQPIHMIVDPPRAGIDKFALDAILQINPQVIAYVSCDPSTLARDAARLIKGGYTLQHVTPFDLFPQTYHIESVSIFTR